VPAGLSNPLGLPVGKHVRIFDAYIEAREAAENGELDAEEAMSISDFPTYLGALVRHTFLSRFNEIQGAWTQYTRPMPLEDFEEYTASRWGRFGDIPEHALNSEYPELVIGEFPAQPIRVREWGAAFSVTRQLIISDRLNKIAEFPGLLAEALARTMSKRAAITKLQGNPTMYDGNALISTNHGNMVTTALVADTTGMANLQTLDLKFDDMTDDESYLIVTPGARTLLIPSELRYVAKALNENAQLPNGSSQLESNLVQGLFSNIIIDPFLTDANNYYVLSDPTGQLSPIAAINLNGNTTPFIGLKDPGVRAVLGGNDPYSFEFDEVKYKIRHDFEFAAVEWRGIVGAIVT
jgi:hypothetical protein